MTLIIRQLRALIFETPLRQKNNNSKTNNKPNENRRKSLSVKISKEPPAIIYFERDNLEDSFECIFDPKVHHDDEKDHPDLLDNCRKKDLKPWQKPPYCSNNKPALNLMNKFKLSFHSNNNNKSTLLIH